MGFLLLAGSAPAAWEVSENSGNLRVANGKIAVTLTQQQGAADILVSAADTAGTWHPVCRTLRPDFATTPAANKLFDTAVTPHRYQANQIFTEFSIATRSDTQVKVRLSGQINNRIVAEQILTLEDDSASLHFEVSASLHEPLLDYFLSTWEFVPPGAPDFVHSPTAKKDDSRSGPAVDQVIGDHAFHSPAIVLQKGGLYACMMPDLAMINAHALQSPDARRTQRVARNQFSVPIIDEFYTMPTALDLNAKSGLTAQPVFSYGMMDFVVSHHMRYQRINDASMVRHLAKPEVRYGYDLIVGADMPQGAAFQVATRHIWQRFGHPQFRDQPHLAMPFAEYVRTIYGVVSKPMPPSIQAPVPGYEDHGVFIDFELNGKPVGGMVSPLGVLGFGDALWNFEFWNNIRDANGMFYWGEKLDMPQLKERGQRIINLALEAPQNEAGFFPLVYRAATGQWVRSSLGPSPSPRSIFDRSAPVYNVPAMSKSAAHMLEFHNRCGKDPRIIAYLRPFADGLLARIDARGAIPSYYTPDMQPIADLHYSAQPAAMMWFLAEMAGVTGDASYRDGAERIAGYLMTEIIPHQRWIDLEVYYSCGANALSYVGDDLQGLPIRGNLSTMWAAKGFKALYQVTRNMTHLEAGLKAAEYMSFSQGSWNPHYVYTANPFGGCTVDNADTATWMDARQCDLVEPFIWYGLELGRQDLVERGIAAARASTVLINHPRHIGNGIYPHVNLYGFGLGPENINHEGHNQSAMRTHPSWGECSGIFTGLADAARFTGSGIIDLDHGFAVGTDGIHLSLEQRDEVFHVTVEERLSELKQPWEMPYEVELMVRGNQRPIYLNGVLATVGQGDDGPVIRHQIVPEVTVTLPDGSFETTGVLYSTAIGGLYEANGWTNLSPTTNIQASSALAANPPNGEFTSTAGTATGSRYLRLVADAGNVGVLAQSHGIMTAGATYTITADIFGGPGIGVPYSATISLVDQVSATPLTTYASQTVSGIANGGFTAGAFNFSYTATAADQGKPLVLLLTTPAVLAGQASRGGLDNVQLKMVSPAPGFTLNITPSASNPGHYHFSWNSQAGKVYDLVSSENLSSPPDTWSVWESQSNIPATGTSTNTLSNIYGGGNPRRFFSVAEKDAP